MEAFGREHGVAALLDHIGLDEFGNEVERLESARDAATRHAAELETILRATREERDTLETAFNNVQGYLKESLATEERLREERGALLKELTQSQIDHRETELLLIEAHRQLTLCEASRDRLAERLTPERLEAFMVSNDSYSDEWRTAVYECGEWMRDQLAGVSE
jgi:chromosome segregation ATPase